MVHLALLHPQSRGQVSLQSNDPAKPPHINFNFLATPDDRKRFRDGIRRVREICQTGKQASLTLGELAPGSADSDEELDAFVRQHVETEYHPSCTCKMGSDKHSVIDASLNVHGLKGLRVVDASVMPDITSANLNAPTIKIAEKAADRILSNDPLPEAVL